MHILTIMDTPMFQLRAEVLYDIYSFLSYMVNIDDEYAPDTSDIPGHRGGTLIRCKLDKCRNTKELVEVLMTCKQIKGFYSLTEGA